MSSIIYWIPFYRKRSSAWNAVGQSRLRCKMSTAKEYLCQSQSLWEHKKIKHVHNLAQCKLYLLFSAFLIHCNAFHSGICWELLPKKEFFFFLFNIKQHHKHLKILFCHIKGKRFDFTLKVFRVCSLYGLIFPLLLSKCYLNPNINTFCQPPGIWHEIVFSCSRNVEFGF